MKRRIGLKNKKVCDNKRRFIHPLKASEAAEQQGRAIGMKLYSYGCQFCGGWHLSKLAAAPTKESTD